VELIAKNGPDSILHELYDLTECLPGLLWFLWLILWDFYYILANDMGWKK